MFSVQIINGDNDPAHPYIAVDRLGMQVDISNVHDGQLWDPTVARIEWGILDQQGRRFGRVTLKSGQSRPFFDQALLTPYLNAYYHEAEKRGLGLAAANTSRRQATQLV